jgi:hypothetical protein
VKRFVFLLYPRVPASSFEHDLFSLYGSSGQRSRSPGLDNHLRRLENEVWSRTRNRTNRQHRSSLAPQILTRTTDPHSRHRSSLVPVNIRIGGREVSSLFLNNLTTRQKRAMQPSHKVGGSYTVSCTSNIKHGGWSFTGPPQPTTRFRTGGRYRQAVFCLLEAVNVAICMCNNR